MAADGISEMRLAVAYVTLSGTELLLRRLSQRLGEGILSTTRKRLITCFDFGITEPEALERWMSLSNATVYAHNSDLLLGSSLKPHSAFHAKMYEFRSTKRANIMVGSANLTQRALTSNSEAAIVRTGMSGLKTLDQAWSRLRAGATTVNPHMVSAYAVLRAKDPPSTSPKIKPLSTLPGRSLWDAINQGKADPGVYDYFWVDGGYLSGGSHSQIELPRGASRFFSFSFTGYNPTQELIGSVDLTVRGSAHESRPLSWHGKNGMERLNLPTGEAYGGSVLLFRRRAAGFDLSWTPTGSQRASVWGRASEAAGQRFRVGQGGTRTCGFF
jgi:hypothetical protein